MSTLNGLPAHILLVHAIVVFVPLAALLLVLSVFRPNLRRRLAGANAILSVVTLALVPVTTNAGEWLERRVPSSEAVRNHTQLGDTALYVALPLAVMALVVWWRGRESDAALLTQDDAAGGGGVATTTRTRTFLAPASTAVTTVVAVLAVVAAVAAAYDVYLIGESGAQSSWQGVSQTPLPGGPQGG